MMAGHLGSRAGMAHTSRLGSKLRQMDRVTTLTIRTANPGAAIWTPKIAACMMGSVARIRFSKATSPGAGQGESQARSPASVKARLSRTSRVQVFSISAFPPGITVEGATPTGRGGGGFWRAPPPPARCRTSGKKQGVALTTSTRLVRRAVTPGEGGHARRSLALLFRRGRGESVLSRV